jgi:hypothetical protein
LRVGRQDAPAWQINQRDADAGQRDIGAINEIYQLKQIDQRNIIVILRIIQQDIATILNLIKIDFESLPVKLKNNKFTIGSEIRGVFHPSENTGKSLNKEQHLISRLYAAISAQRKNIYKDFSKSMADLIWQL